MRLKSAVRVIFLVLVTWAGAAGISYAVVETTGGGPRGEQGPQGEQGPRGPAAPAAPTSSVSACDKALEAYLEGLSTPGLSEFQISTLYGVFQTYCE